MLPTVYPTTRCSLMSTCFVTDCSLTAYEKLSVVLCTISVALCKTVVTPAYQQWSYCSLTLSHLFMLLSLHRLYGWWNATDLMRINIINNNRNHITSISWQRVNICLIFCLKSILDPIYSPLNIRTKGIRVDMMLGLTMNEGDVSPIRNWVHYTTLNFVLNHDLPLDV